jgi:1-acyl-sn-glycerol-3-phosphate acyltransferase
MQKLLWNISWLVLRPLLRIFCRFKINGAENLRGISGPVILAIATHSHILDSYIVGAAMPFNCRLYPVRYMTKESFFKIPIVAGIIRAYGAFPVVRGQEIKNVLLPAAKLLEKNSAVGIFIEGKISREGKLRELKKGVSCLAFLTEAPVLPIALKGTYQIRNPLKFLFTKRKINVSFGKPIKISDFGLSPDQNLENQENIEKFTKIIENQIKTLFRKDIASADAERKKLYFSA